ncbi:hypothetical protein FLP10_05255 [Agromyces intestinalis]|uniref:Uncharacterized protein n=1 Tax=Agromyces intestinalis TaxID=2592652 RepID=A0A5C1YD06_9MICO|nr:hypothetical protein [Agromyces intestinalis]QEO13896.1 hypothetical protein FLP10_05255 [Agromyces intestinalis]
MTGIEVVLTALGVIVLLGIASFVTVVLLMRTLYRRIRHSAKVEGTALRTRARVSRGPQRTVLALRVRLDDTLRSGTAAIALISRPDTPGPRGELPRLFGRIREEGRVLDLQLRLMESETDASQLASELPTARRRVDQVERLVRLVRSAVASGLSGATDDTLAALDSDVAREVAALHVGIEELQALNRRDTISQPTAIDKRNRS